MLLEKAEKSGVITIAYDEVYPIEYCNLSYKSILGIAAYGKLFGEDSYKYRLSSLIMSPCLYFLPLESNILYSQFILLLFFLYLFVEIT